MGPFSEHPSTFPAQSLRLATQPISTIRYIHRVRRSIFPAIQCRRQRPLGRSASPILVHRQAGAFEETGSLCKELSRVAGIAREGERRGGAAPGGTPLPE